MKQHHYEFIVSLWQYYTELTSDFVNKYYYTKKWKLMSWGARLCMLCDNGYFERMGQKDWLMIYKITQKGQDWDGSDIIIQSPAKGTKPKKTREESMVKTECREINYKIQPTTLWGKIQYIYDVWMSL